ncbi:MAG: allantoinase AllB [Bacteroidia bacterium]
MKTKSTIFGIHSINVLTENGLKDATLIIENGIISDIKDGKIDADFVVEELHDLVVMPGIIDSHVHINEPGRTEWEGFETITKAAVAGGITTLVDMPLNSSPVTTTVATFQQKLDATVGKLYCNCAFWGGVVPDNINELEALIKSGVLGIKAFLTHSGIDEFPNVTLSDLKAAMPILAKYNVPLLAHAEIDEMHDGIIQFEKNPTNYKAYLNSRPKEWEDNAVDLLIALCEEFKSPIHIVHLSSANNIEKIAAAKAKGLPLTVETCPQYLYFNAEDIPNASTLFKCAPPIREQENNQKLWDALKNGTIDFIVTDHSPATPELKKIESGNLKEAWGGIASIQFSLPVVWTKAKEKGFKVSEMAQLMSNAVARFIGQNKKGALKVGYDADIVVWNPNEQFIVQKENILYRHKISPYVGEKLYGVVKQTYVGGKKVYENGNFLSLPQGNLIIQKH